MNETMCFLDDALATTNQFIELHRMFVNCFIMAAQVAGYSSVIWVPSLHYHSMSN